MKCSQSACVNIVLLNKPYYSLVFSSSELIRELMGSVASLSPIKKRRACDREHPLYPRWVARVIVSNYTHAHLLSCGRAEMVFELCSFRLNTLPDRKFVRRRDVDLRRGVGEEVISPSLSTAQLKCMPTPADSFKRRRALAQVCVCVCTTACYVHPRIVTADDLTVCILVKFV
ncbi:hypothetical protein EVAR_42380_1 [Eumeta japonica]|uniref:Uncharacterized protein n=1 Tax=Eumeta variegata TaxID=151549 RepID=A0A4C1YL30_EUMVA|nr:hypothetical protein EVAR_42380_1 [Eumeta japonica]